MGGGGGGVLSVSLPFCPCDFSTSSYSSLSSCHWSLSDSFSSVFWLHVKVTQCVCKLDIRTSLVDMCDVKRSDRTMVSSRERGKEGGREREREGRASEHMYAMQ